VYCLHNEEKKYIIDTINKSPGKKIKDFEDEWMMEFRMNL
jgi:hypothetical protein